MHRHVVGDEQDRRAELALDFVDHRQHALLDDDVERRGRLVGDDEFGPADGGERDGDALAHAARELVRKGLENLRREMQALQVAAHDLEERRHRLADVAEGEVDEGMPHPPHRVQHVHRALHDVGEVLPADRRQLLAIDAVDVDGPVAEIEHHRACQHFERRLDRVGDGLDQGGLAAARFAGEAVDLVGGDAEADIVDGADLALDPERGRPVVGAQARHGEDGFAHPPVRPRRLRGSMYSFIDTASRKSPMKVMTTSSTGKKIHHQMPATRAVCWLAQ